VTKKETFIKERGFRISNMSKLEARLASIEIGLESEDYNRVIEDLNKIKKENPDYPLEKEGYLIDFYMGQAIFRKEISSKTKPKQLEKARQHLKKSLESISTFADGHLMQAYNSMVLGQILNSEFYRLESKYEFQEALKINPFLQNEVSPKISALNQSIKQDYDITICANNEEVILELMIEFEKFPWIKIEYGDITTQKADAIVSPANSFGFMDGGLDHTLSEYFGWDLQEKLQKIIKEKHHGELLVGKAEILETGNEEVPYLISAPTMRVPMEIKDSMNPYLATRAVFIALEKFNSEEKRINSVLIPSMGTGIGKVPYDISARQMRAAYEDILLNQNKFPQDFADAQHKNKVLSMDHFYQLYKGQY